MTTKERAVSLLDRLCEEDVAAIVPLLERLAAPSIEELVARWNEAPPDEPLTQDELRALAEAREARARGESGITHEEMGRRMAQRQRKAA